MQHGLRALARRPFSPVLSSRGSQPPREVRPLVAQRMSQMPSSTQASITFMRAGSGMCAWNIRRILKHCQASTSRPTILTAPAPSPLNWTELRWAEPSWGRGDGLLLTPAKWLAANIRTLALSPCCIGEPSTSVLVDFPRVCRQVSPWAVQVAPLLQSLGR